MSNHASEHPLPRPTMGDTVAGRYLLEELIGEGGYAEVFRAKHTYLKTTVALKILGAGRHDEIENKRFAREAFALAKMNHPNCLSVTDFGDSGGVLFLTTEYLEGESLGSRLRRDGAMPLGQAIDALAQLLRGLKHAHERGIIHRDLKPDNIVLSQRDGQTLLKILDFGLARLTGEILREEGGGDLTRAGITFGTPRYMAPEQSLGSAVDHRADIYAAGVIAYHMLCGRAPFEDDETGQLLLAHQRRSVPSFRDVGAKHIPTPLEMVVMKALEKSASQRYSSAGEFLSALGNAVSTLAATSRPTPATTRQPQRDRAIATVQERAFEPTRYLRKQRRRWAGLAAVVGVAALAIASAVSTAGAVPPAPSLIANQAPNPVLGPVSKASVAAGEDPKDDYFFDDAQLLEAQEQIATGRSERAIALLKRERAANTTQGQASFLLGTLYIRKMWWSQALSAYETAIERQPKFREHPLLQKNAVAALGSRSKPQLAERFITKHLGRHALSALDEAAVSSKHRHHRDRARLLAQKLRQGDSQPRRLSAKNGFTRGS